MEENVNASLYRVESSFDLREMSAYEFIAHIFGFIYLISWSLSFYP